MQTDSSADAASSSAGATGASAPPSRSAGIPVAAALSESLISMLGPMVEATDSSITAAVDSQAKLSQQIDKVAGELQTFLAASQLPSFAPYAERLSEVRRRATAAGNTLTAVQQRLARVEAMAERLSDEEKLTLARVTPPNTS